MTKLKGPISSLNASGTISRCITFLKRQKQKIAEKKPEVKDEKTPAQLSWRHMFLKCTALWHALSAAEKAEWESLARAKHMTGYAWFQSKCLRPNPGIYLPLQGGTMSGDIDMAKYRVLRLPAPVDLQEPLRRQDYVTYIQPFLHAMGARVYNSANIAIPNTTYTTVTFNSQRYDTDAIHSVTANTSRLTCKTAGKYLIVFNGHFFDNATGQRLGLIKLNNTTWIARFVLNGAAAPYTGLIVTTIYDLNVTDFVEIIVWQDSGGALNLLNWNQATPEFMMQRIGT